MSGHSKWANIKVRKGAQDKKRSETFTRTAKDILTAIRMGGGNTNPESNSALRVAIEKARGVSMPKDNIQRLLDNFEARKANLANFVFEGFGPFGVPLIVEVETDNKNRTLSEIKMIFREYDGNLGEIGSVSYLFERRGEIELENVSEEMQLDLIDDGALDFDDNTVIVGEKNLNEVKKKIESRGLAVKRAETTMAAKAPIMLSTEDEVARIMEMIDDLEANDDVINVYAGFDYGKKD